MTADRVVQVDVSRGVATLTLDSPANRNALSRAMRAQLRTALADALADDAVRVVVLDHTGRVFCSGMDLAEAAGGGVAGPGRARVPRPAGADLVRAQAGGGGRPRTGPGRRGGPARRVRRRRRRRVGDVRLLRGAARRRAGGDLRRRAAADGAARRAPADAHRRRCSTPTTAAAGGLVDLVVPDADVDGEVRAQLVAPDRRRARRAGRDQAAAARRDADLGFDELLELSARFFASEEGQEGIASFREKRPARWVPDAD